MTVQTTTRTAVRSSLEVVARRVEADIKSRGLVSGDKYLTGDEVGRMLNISSVTANRAMQMLAERGLLVRQRKAGTFIGDGLKAVPNAVRKRVHMVLTSGIWPAGQSVDSYTNQLLGGVVEVLPGVSIQVDVIGPQEVNAFIRQVIDNFSSTGEVAGVVLVRSSPDAQRQLVEAGVPSVVFGSLFPGVRGIGCVDVDQRQVGRLTADYLIRAKHSRVLTLMLNQWSPGDNAFVSGLMGTLQSMAAEIDVDLQSVPIDNEVCFGIVREALRRDEGPTAVVVRSPWLARNASEVIGSLGLSVPKDVEIVVGNHHEVEIDGRRLPGAKSIESMHECGRKLGRMLADMNQSHSPNFYREEMVPVQFIGS